MAHVTAIPSRWLKASAALAHWALWTLAVAWTTLGLLWGGLHFLIVPRINDFRPWLEQQASQRMGIRVQIGDIAAKSNGLIPSVELRNVRFLDTDGREALRLPSVLAALSPRSAFGLGFEQLYIDSPELTIRRAADGHIWIAGFALPDASTDGRGAADWVFGQTELAVRHGKVRWNDELRGVPQLELADMDVMVRNRGRQHTFRIDADPPAGWGTRLSLQGRFRQPLFTSAKGDWRNWSGQLFAQATQIDLAQLRSYIDLGVELSQGTGSLRAWVDVDHAAFSSATADLALQAVTVKLAPALDALDLEKLFGRLGVRAMEGGYELSTEGLRFDTRDGLHWPGGNLQMGMYRAQANKPAHGTLIADRLDLDAMTEIANRLPLDDAVQASLHRLTPKGLVDRLQMSWQGELAALLSFAAKGRVTGLELAAQPQGRSGIPGLRGAALDFDLTQDGGRVSIAMKNGVLDFPGIFESTEIALDDLSGDVQWKLDGAHISVEANKLRFSNADAQGEATVKWQSNPGVRNGPTESHSLGVLDLQSTFSRANLAALPRYLPLALNKDAREYLAQAMLAGEGSNVKLKVKGNLDHFPFDDAKQGDFHISADVKNASYSYAPASYLPKEGAPWPLLTQLTGELVMDHDSLQVKATKGLLASGSALQLSKADVSISKLYDNPQVSVTAEARGPLADALAFVNATPLGAWTGEALARTAASGLADYRFKLALPLGHLERSTVQGSISLGGADFQYSPAVPRLSRVKGVISFTESGFSLAGVQCRALGGDLRLDGGLTFGAATTQRGSGSLRLQGTATAEGLRQASELGLLPRIAQFASGSTSYSANLAVRAGVPELQVNSNLTGLALNLPEPFTKSAEGALPLHLESMVVRSSLLPGARLQDQWQLELGQLASVNYVRDISGSDAKVLRGSIGVGLSGEEAAPPPHEGVSANVHAKQVDVDAWTAVLSHVAGNTTSGSLLLNSASMAYFPTSMALQAQQLTVDGRTFNKVLIGGAREGLVWRGNVEATELNGYLEYRQSSGTTPGRVYARLAHLVLGQSAEQDVENLLDQQPSSIPALDIVVEDMDLRGKKLGRVDIQAVNLGVMTRDAAREWRLNRFNISNPEASLTATGNWVDVNAQSPNAAPRGLRERRRTVLNFKLDVLDSGDLLKRFGMPGLIAKGKGKIEGQVSWLGSPFSPDYASMGGGFNINMESGQFLKADPGIAKLLGVLSLQSLPRRLALDFRDVFSDGFAFDYVRGDATIAQGIAHTSNLQMKGVNAAVLMEGQADIAKETQLLKVVVIPEINVGSASLLYSAINPLVGLTTFLANVILRRPLIDANTQEFLIDGTWVDPRVTKVERKPEPSPTNSKSESKESKP